MFLSCTICNHPFRNNLDNVLIGVCGHFACEECGKKLYTIKTVINCIGETSNISIPPCASISAPSTSRSKITRTPELIRNFPNENANKKACRCGAIFTILENSSPILFETAVHVQANVLMTKLQNIQHQPFALMLETLQRINENM